MILQDTLDLLRTKYRDDFLAARIDRALVGVFFTAVRLSGGHCGLARTETGACNAAVRPGDRELGAFSPGAIAGARVADLFAHLRPAPLLEGVKLACLNALSMQVVERSGLPVIEGRDPLDLVGLDGRRSFCLVGAFQSYIRRVEAAGNPLTVLELDAGALAPEDRPYFAPAGRAAEVLRASEVVVITGSTLVNHTLDGLLAQVPPSARTLLVGPSGGLLPEVLFARGIHLIGTLRVTDPDRMFAVLGEGGAGYHLFRDCARKICIAHEA
ncbi:MAG: DUF364 domain-containing protein [Acidobacteria bacterium]|nr:DUF364 domain-containing protein [Acidobacteriota bacterium]